MKAGRQTGHGSKGHNHSGTGLSLLFQFPAIVWSYRRFLLPIMPGKSSIRPQRWPVKRRQGQVLGYVKSMTNHSSSKQVISVICVLQRTKRQMRLPLDRFEIAGEQPLLYSLSGSTDIQERRSYE